MPSIVTASRAELIIAVEAVEKVRDRLRSMLNNEDKKSDGTPDDSIDNMMEVSAAATDELTAILKSVGISE